MKLIFDCGSTKCAVGVVTGNGDADEIISLDSGFNACVHEASQLEGLLDMLCEKVHGGNVTDVWFYGAGCREGQPIENVRRSLAGRFKDANVSVASDMLGAARAVCGNRPGIVGILGTGSNSCHYDGMRITANVSPLGYILGDEGSGAVLGKLFLGRMFKGGFPQEVR
ncbi:MAG: ATPase, partial [Duncaniella sp.]|nr:ATPase [Duncaniella sp.]